MIQEIHVKAISRGKEIVINFELHIFYEGSVSKVFVEERARNFNKYDSILFRVKKTHLFFVKVKQSFIQRISYNIRTSSE